MKVLDKIGLGAVLVIIVTNPASGQFVLDGLDYIFEMIFSYASPVNFVASGVLMGYILYQILWVRRERINIPDKKTPTIKAGKLIG